MILILEIHPNYRIINVKCIIMKKKKAEVDKLFITSYLLE